MSTKRPVTARGMRDLLPADMRKRRYVCDILAETFEVFGFEPLDTPAMERAETILGKYGPDAERLIYRAGLGREEDLALRYDLTVSTARVAATYEDLPRPFKRYQIAPVWRGERPQKGRYREFVQADVDIIGEAGVLADAEIIAMVTALLERLGFPSSRTKINNRKLLTGLGRMAGVPEALLPGLYRAIDKLDKIGLAGVRRELRGVGLPGELLNRQRQAVDRWLRGTADRSRLRQNLEDGLEADADARLRGEGIDAFLDALEAYPFGQGLTPELLGEARAGCLERSIDALRGLVPAEELIPDAVTDSLLELLGRRGEPRELLARLEDELEDPLASEGIAELRRVLDALDAAGVPPERYEVDVAMVRGLDYYTGTIFETVVDEAAFGSMTGGGRYDELLGMFGAEMPAVGTSFGIDRLIDAMEALELFPPELLAAGPSVLVCLFDEDMALESVRLASLLRSSGVATELSFRASGIGDQIRQALRREIPLVVILGPDELAAGEVTLRDLRTREQLRVARSELAEAVQARLVTRT